MESASPESLKLYPSTTESGQAKTDTSNEELNDSQEDINEKSLLTDEKENFSNGTLVLSETEGEAGEDEVDDRTFCDRLHNDKTYRRNYLLTLNLIAAFFSLGWMAGQAGPSFLDLQLITNVSLDRGSAFFTAGGVGYLSGSLVTGYVFDKIKDKVFIVFISLVGMGITTAAIPFCYIYELMVFVQLVRGITAGGLDTSGNTLLSRTWGNKGRMFMQALHFGFAFGGSISPLAIAPFLTPERNSVDLSNDRGSINASMLNSSSTIYDNTTNTSYELNPTESPVLNYDSTLYIAYTITALMCIVCCIPAFFIFCNNRRRRKQEKKMKLAQNLPSEEKKEDKHHVKMTRNMKIIVIINLVLILMFYCAVEDSYISFLSTFCVRQLHWTKVKGALITSVLWTAFAVGRLAGIFLVVIFAPSTLIFMHASLELASLIAIFVSVTFHFDLGMWIFSPILGFAMSVIFPCIFTWTEVSFMPVTGRLSSLFLVVACTASSINPIILGEIMDKFSNLWFIYLLTGEACLLYVCLILAFFISRKVKVNTKPSSSEITEEAR